MIKIISSVLLIGSASLAFGAYPSTYTAGYGFVSHGGIGPHGHYLPAVARVKVHKDPFQTHYSLDEEGPTHYKYIRHSGATDPHDPLLHHSPADHLLGHHHHHHSHVAAVATPGVPVHGGIIAAPVQAAIPVPGVAAVGIAGEPYYNDYGAYPHVHGGYY